MKKTFPIITFILLLSGCAPVQTVFTGHTHPHEEYGDGLNKAGLANTAIGRSWLEAAENALQDTVVVVPPFQETAYFPSERPMALGYRFQARRGEKIRIVAEIVSFDSIRFFIDVYELREGRDRIEHVTSAAGDPEVEFTAGRDRTYIVRVQPELLRSARVTLTITSGASLVFPVAGFDSRSIRSFFGDGRDGGKRRHEGVDAFAPKGTPLISVSNGMARAANNKLGGKVVWVNDGENNINLYYAHLDSQYVGLMQQVRVGDTLGTVGNSGNAKHTPPHLHFGIYARGEGAVDPLPFLNTPLQEPVPVSAALELLETPARISAKTTVMRVSAAPKAVELSTLSRNAFVSVVAASAGWYRVRDGSRTGYVLAKDVSSIDTPVKRIELAGNRQLLDAPAVGAAPIRELDAGEQVELLAEYGAYQKVRTSDHELGWVLEQASIPP